MQGCFKPEDPLRSESLVKSWGESGSWHMHGACPKTKEMPYNNRKFEFFPSEDSGVYDEWGIGVVNTKGCKGPEDKTIGQDNFSISRLTSNWEAFCVMDGHGGFGHWPATRAATFLPHILQSSECTAMMKHGQAEAALLHAFSQTEADLEKRCVQDKVDLITTGCTACCVLRHPSQFPHRLWVATIGDSRAVMFAPGRGLLKETTDHKPTLPKEMARLDQMGCEVRVKEHAAFSETRIFLKGREYPGLCMSRTFGDLIVKGNGVVAEPVVEQWSYEGIPGAMLLIASDGVWEFMSSHKAVQVVLEAMHAGKSCDGAVAELVQESITRWQANEENYCDDITAVLVPLTAGSAPPSETGPQDNHGCDSSCVVS